MRLSIPTRKSNQWIKSSGFRGKNSADWIKRVENWYFLLVDDVSVSLWFKTAQLFFCPESYFKILLQHLPPEPQSGGVCVLWGETQGKKFRRSILNATYISNIFRNSELLCCRWEQLDSTRTPSGGILISEQHWNSGRCRGFYKYLKSQV